MCFNPRTHEGCDLFEISTLWVFHVSIHAPTRGCDFTPRTISYICQCFNPRTHEGCDFLKTKMNNTHFVSIHAPTRGATRLCIKTSYPTTVSIHAPTRGATKFNLHLTLFHVFQSTHPRGVRQTTVIKIVILSSFNPRTHEGCDYHKMRMRPDCEGFNPRTHEGCDL